MLYAPLCTYKQDVLNRHRKNTLNKTNSLHKISCHRQLTLYHVTQKKSGE